MEQSTPNVEIFLQQGDVYFGGKDTKIRTVLGSCVAITMWHPELLTGGMCHYMLPTRHPRGAKYYCRIRTSPIGFPSRRKADREVLDGKYADEALELMFSEVQRSGTRACDYQIKVFGGGNMFPSICQPRDQHIGKKNVDIVSRLLAHHGLKSSAQHLGGNGHRSLVFEIGTGNVWMQHQQPMPLKPSPCDTCEARELCLHA